MNWITPKFIFEQLEQHLQPLLQIKADKMSPDVSSHVPPQNHREDLAKHQTPAKSASRHDPELTAKAEARSESALVEAEARELQPDAEVDEQGTEAEGRSDSDSDELSPAVQPASLFESDPEGTLEAADSCE
jgi:hypothetical protein